MLPEVTPQAKTKTEQPSQWAPRSLHPARGMSVQCAIHREQYLTPISCMLVNSLPLFLIGMWIIRFTWNGELTLPLAMCTSRRLTRGKRRCVSVTCMPCGRVRAFLKLFGISYRKGFRNLLNHNMQLQNFTSSSTDMNPECVFHWLLVNYVSLIYR